MTPALAMIEFAPIFIYIGLALAAIVGIGRLLLQWAV
jgi:hypothetical protein